MPSPVLAVLLSLPLASSLQFPSSPSSASLSRRGVLAALPTLCLGRRAFAAEEETVKMYFGAGCFWHVQHEMVLEEVASLGRKAGTVSAISGYAGGKSVGSSSRVCYHNPRNIADYGSLGHAEAVQVELPVSQVPAFAKRYVGLFGSRGIRHDPQDRGGEYRSVLGLPGGVSSPHMSAIREAVAASPMALVEGSGNEEDTLGDRTILVMDSAKFPFYPAEVYHQFHNDFMGPPYGAAYNKLQASAVDAGRLKETGCPEYPRDFF